MKFGCYRIEQQNLVIHAYFDGAQSLTETISYFTELELCVAKLDKWVLYVHSTETAIGTPEAAEYSVQFLPKLSSLNCVGYIIESQNPLVKAHADALAQIVAIPFLCSNQPSEIELFLRECLD